MRGRALVLMVALPVLIWPADLFGDIQGVFVPATEDQWTRVSNRFDGDRVIRILRVRQIDAPALTSEGIRDSASGANHGDSEVGLIPWDHVQKLQTSTRSTRKSFLIGGVVGVVVLGALGGLVAAAASDIGPFPSHDVSATPVLAGVALGFLIGGGIGAAVGPKRTQWSDIYERESAPSGDPPRNIEALQKRVFRGHARVVNEFSMAHPRATREGVEGIVRVAGPGDTLVVRIPWEEVGSIRIPYGNDWDLAYRGREAMTSPIRK